MAVSLVEEQQFKVISSENMDEFGLDFLSYIDPKYVKDIKENMEWYLNSYRENPQVCEYNEILLNVGYPSKMEREFL
jgi:2-oxo-4-hydroxy-4-carboxy--5-ureidoimidazoline (OHCU) decarboxylase